MLKSIPEADCTIYIDASTKSLGVHDKHHSINGRWTEGETKQHVNVLKLNAIKFGLYHYQKGSLTIYDF